MVSFFLLLTIRVCLNLNQHTENQRPMQIQQYSANQQEGMIADRNRFLHIYTIKNTFQRELSKYGFLQFYCTNVIFTAIQNNNFFIISDTGYTNLPFINSVLFRSWPFPGKAGINHIMPLSWSIYIKVTMFITFCNYGILPVGFCQISDSGIFYGKTGLHINYLTTNRRGYFTGVRKKKQPD